jgi:hypothetical protein
MRMKAPEMSKALKGTRVKTFVIGKVADGHTFAEYSVPGGRTIRVMDEGVLRESLRRSDGLIRSMKRDIHRRHGATG